MHKYHLAMETLLTSSLDYSSDEDGNVAIYQNDCAIHLTPSQQQAVVSLLGVNLDCLRNIYYKSCEENR